MDSKAAILTAATELIRQRGDRLDSITVREICSRAHVGLGLVNYHFGSKEQLLALCIEQLIHGIVETFQRMEQTESPLAPFDRLEQLGELTLTFLMEHEAIARVSILGDLQAPKPDDNTHRTYRAYLPLVATCRPDWTEWQTRQHTAALITLMQQAFLRRAVLRDTLGVDLQQEDQRRAFHHQILCQILEVQP